MNGHKLSLIHISEPTRRTPISYAVFCLKKNADQQDLHYPLRRQRQMCIRDRSGGDPLGEENEHETENSAVDDERPQAVSYTHLRAHETDSYLVCRLLLEKKRRPTRSTLSSSSAASDVYKRQIRRRSARRRKRARDREQRSRR